MIGFLIELLKVIQLTLTLNAEQEKATGRRNVEAEVNRLLLDELKRFLTPLLESGSQELPRVTAATINEARHLANRCIEILSRYAADQAGDYLEDRALSPALAAAAGSRLYKALTDLLAVTEAQEKWLKERFSQPFLERVKFRNYRPVGPADIDIKLLQLQLALQIAESDTERALRDLNQNANPLKYLMPGMAQPATPPAAPPAVQPPAQPPAQPAVQPPTQPSGQPAAQPAAQTTAAPPAALPSWQPATQPSGQPAARNAAPLAAQPEVRIVPVSGPEGSLKTTASKADIKTAQQKYVELINLLQEHVSNIMSDLQKATIPGGGIDPHTVRIAIGTTLYICVLGLRLIQEQRSAVSILSSNIVEARK